jgi:hypothetical protein
MEKDGGRGREGIAASCIAHRACGFRKWGTSRIEGRGRERRLDWLARSAVDAYRDLEAGSGEPCGPHAAGTVDVDRQGGMGTRGYDPSSPAAQEPQYTIPAHRPFSSPSAIPPKSPHPRLFIAARARSPIISRLPPACLPSRLQAPCTPIGFQYMLDRDPISLTPPRPPPEHLPACSSPEADSSSVLSPSRPRLSVAWVILSTCAAGREGGFGGGATSSISFFGLCLFYDDISDLPTI